MRPPRLRAVQVQRDVRQVYRPTESGNQTNEDAMSRLHLNCPNQTAADLILRMAEQLGCSPVGDEDCADKTTAEDLALLLAPGLDWIVLGDDEAVAHLRRGSIKAHLRYNGRDNKPVLSISIRLCGLRWFSDRLVGVEDIERDRLALAMDCRIYMSIRDVRGYCEQYVENRMEDALMLLDGIEA